jgi:phosphohistidine phosphatase SixA
VFNMEIILVRHGKADNSEDTMDDTKRSLTPDGRKKLQKTLPSLGLLIKNMDKAQIWTSPLDRAVQTAEIIARLFNLQDIQQYDFIRSGDFAGFTDALAGVKASATIIVVGHEPSLGEWAQQLCGLALPFKKGAAAGISVGKLNPLESELLWFFQPQPIGRLSETLLNNSFHCK